MNNAAPLGGQPETPLTSEAQAEYSAGYTKLFRFGARLVILAGVLLLGASVLAVVAITGPPDGRVTGMVVILTGLALIAWMTVGMVIMVLILDVLYYELRSKALLRVLGRNAQQAGTSTERGLNAARRFVGWVRVNADLLSLAVNGLIAIATVGALVIAALALWFSLSGEPGSLPP